MLPTREEALKLIRDGLLFNPGPWGKHCLTAAHCAEKIASACGDMDVEKAYILGLLLQESSSIQSNKRNTFLNQVDKEAREKVEMLVEQMAEQWGVTEELKMQDQMEWVRRMNNIQATAEEIAHKNIIFM